MLLRDDRQGKCFLLEIISNRSYYVLNQFRGRAMTDERQQRGRPKAGDRFRENTIDPAGAVGCSTTAARSSSSGSCRSLAGGLGASQVSKRLSFDFSLPGQPGYETAAKVDRLYGNGGNGPSSVAVVTLPAGQTVAGDAAPVGRAFAIARRRCRRHASSTTRRRTTRSSSSRDGRSTFALVFTPVEKSFGAPKAAAARRRGPWPARCRPARMSS